MVTTNCQEIAGVNCQVPLSGNSLDELKKNVFAHAQKESNTKTCLRKNVSSGPSQNPAADRSDLQEEIRQRRITRRLNSSQT